MQDDETIWWYGMFSVTGRRCSFNKQTVNAYFMDRFLVDRCGEFYSEMTFANKHTNQIVSKFRQIEEAFQRCVQDKRACQQ
jgi:hypothetical protein